MGSQVLAEELEASIGVVPKLPRRYVVWNDMVAKLTVEDDPEPEQVPRGSPLRPPESSRLRFGVLLDPHEHKPDLVVVPEEAGDAFPILVEPSVGSVLRPIRLPWHTANASAGCLLARRPKNSSADPDVE